MCSLYFPPFSLISTGLQEIQREKVQRVIVVPTWPTQTWWPFRAFADANVERQPNPPPKQKRLLTLPFNPANIHPLYPKLELLMCHLSGDPLKAKEFRRKLQGLSYSPGGLVLQANTKFTTKSGNCSAVNGTLIHFKPLCKMV